MFAENIRQERLKQKIEEGVIRIAGFLAEHNLEMNLMITVLNFSEQCPVIRKSQKK